MNNPNLLKANKPAFDKANALLAGFIFLFTFIVYYKTMAPTFSFWDCGEFVACSYILGVPHPPGTPLYVLLGRLFAMLPIAGDIAVRINILSVLTASIGATFGYLANVRLIRYWFKDQTNLKNRIVVYIGGVAGSLFMAFSNTNWANSVEAEVYAATIMIMTIIYWLVLKYFDARETPQGTKYMLMIAYVAILGVGIHLTLFLVFPVAALYFIMKKESGVRQWVAISLFIMTELYLIFQLSSRLNDVANFLPVLIVFVILLFHTVMQIMRDRDLWITFGLFGLSLWSFYFVVVDAISKNLTGIGLSEAMIVAANLPLTNIGIFGLAGWGGYQLLKYLKDRNTGEDSLYLAIYSLAPVVLLAVKYTSSGYGAFFALTLVVIGLVGLALYKYINWIILVAIGSISMVVIGFMPFIYGLIVGFVLVVILGVVLNDKSWKVGAIIILLAAIGFSVNLYTPIRSMQDPIIDENNPETFTAFKNFLERKQYGNVSMTERMFKRRAEWSNQFGDYRRMGFWGFFKEQYGFASQRFFVVLMFGLFGLWEMIRRRPKIGLPFFVYLLICSVGLILYMNFSDGTRYDAARSPYDYLEVRDRDYFFTPAFVFFGLAIGLGISAFIQLVRESFEKSSEGIKNISFGMSCILVFLPAFPLTKNYFRNDQSGNYMPYDYAYNELISCEKDAILITNADNDTFPAWCIQEVYGFRKDVKIVNLSLGNTPWYIKQLRDNYKVPISWTDEQIERLVPYKDREGNVYRIQDQLVDNIISANKWKYPINITVTISPNNIKYRNTPLVDNLVIEGMVYRLSPNKDDPPLDYMRTDSMFNQVYKYRGIADPTVHKNETALRLANNYAQGYLFLADSMKRANDFDGAIKHVRQGLALLPQSGDIYTYLAQLLGDVQRADTIEAVIESAPLAVKERMYYNYAMAAKFAGHLEESERMLSRLYLLYPEYTDGYQALVRFYYEKRDFGKLYGLVKDWTKRHPGDRESSALLQQIEQELIRSQGQSGSGN